MNVWEFIAKYNSSSNFSQYRKWLDLKLGHFFCTESEDEIIPFTIQLKTAKKAIEAYRESGNYLLYLSSIFYQKNDLAPIFLSPILPIINQKARLIEWRPISLRFWLNNEISDTIVECNEDELRNWLTNQSFIDKSNIVEREPALFFNLDSKKIIRNDIKNLRNLREESQAIQEIFHDNIRSILPKENLGFLDFAHILPLDYSQAQAIANSSKQSLVISGPPGTGKSQTILNLAIEEIKLGKKVAILSQKKAAMEVIDKRLKTLDLNFLAMTTISDENSQIAEIENVLEIYINTELNSEPIVFNLAYYQYCIRTLEDYFNASKSLQNAQSLSNFSQFDFIDRKRFENNYKWIFPRLALMDVSQELINKYLLEFQVNLFNLKTNFEDNTFQLINQLQSIFRLITKVNRESIIKFQKSKKLKVELRRIDKKIKAKLENRPKKESEIHKLSSEKLEFYLDFLKKSHPLFSIFNRKAALITHEIENIYPAWSKLNVWEKIEQIRKAIDYKLWESEFQVLNNEKNNLISEISDNTQFEVLEYIADKISSKLPFWDFANRNCILNPHFDKDKKTWQNIFTLNHTINSYNPDFQYKKIDDFILNFDFFGAIDKLEWNKLCSFDFKSEIDWNNFLINESYSSEKSPVLKNYSKREIVQLAQYSRANYEFFRAFQLSQFKYDFISERHNEINRILDSRKLIDKAQKQVWKKNIQFIQKKWSSKRKKISFYQYLSALDFDFSLWIKPLFIGTLEQFSQYVPLKKEIYDTLIIDESSQIEAMDIIPALFRAKKVIIVGDNKQLTPMRFFRLQESNSHDAYESILELAEEKLPKLQLNYHYRSVSNDLISYSNQYFYENKLITQNKKIPNSLEWVYCPEGVYSQRKNTIEAQKIVDRLTELSYQIEPDLSVGIICFSIQQRDEIELQLEKAMASNSSLNRMIQRLNEQHDYFFIRSIEHVQGDERDIIIISTGYAANPEGKFYQYFGPILSFNGENRLNVLMSRARKKIIFISSINSSSISLKSSSSKGLILFKNLLEFMENRGLTAKSKMNLKDNYWEYFLHPFKK